MRTLFTVTLGAALLVAGLSVAEAQTGGVCQLTEGKAIIAPGTIDEDPNPGAGPFAFTGTLSGPGGDCDGLMVCSTGTIENASCLENTHSGSGKICQSCSLACGYDANQNPKECTPENVGDAEILCDGEQMAADFQGVCVGALCTGVGPAVPGIAYALLFNQATVESALAVCNDPTAPDDSIDEAGFDGVLAHGGP